MHSPVDDEEDLTVVEEQTVSKRRDGEEETVAFTRRSSLFPEERRPPSFAEEMSPFAHRRFPLQAALPRDRFAAFFIDTVVLAYLNLALSYPLKQFLLKEPWFAAYASWTFTLQIGVFLILALLYYVLFESLGGATLGKLLCRLKVVDLEGDIPTLANVFLRNLCRLFDYPFLFLVAILSMESSHFYQRLGDRAAHTLVIKKTRKRLDPIDLRSVPLSSTFVRITAFLIDLILYGTFLWLYGLALNPQKAMTFQAMLWLFPFFGGAYFMIFEFLVSSTPGKIILNRKVVFENGEPLDATAAILRNLTRPLDLFLGYPLLALTRRKQRLGDLLTDTLVIKHKSGRKGILSLICLLMILGTLAYLASHNSQRQWWNTQVTHFLARFQTGLSLSVPSPSFPSIDSSYKSKLPPPQLQQPPSNKGVPFAKPKTTSAALKVTEFYFAAGPDPTQIRSDGVFHSGDLIFTFFKVAGFQKETSGKVNLIEDAQLIGPQGDLLMNKTGVAQYSQGIPSGSQHILFANQIDLPRNTPVGIYQLILTLKDGLGGGQLVYEKSFTIQ